MARFDDHKDDEALRTIGEVAEALGIKPHVLRYWEQQFAALQPLKRGGGRRYYRSADIALIERIDRLIHQEGYTLKGAQAVLRAGHSGNAESAGAAPEQVRTPAVEDALSQLREVRGQLAAALER